MLYLAKEMGQNSVWKSASESGQLCGSPVNPAFPIGVNVE